MSISLRKILTCYLVTYQFITDVSKDAFLKTNKPPLTTYVVKFPSCSEQLFYRTTWNSCFSIGSFIKLG